MYRHNQRPKKTINLTKSELALLILVTAVLTFTIQQLLDLRAI